MDLVFAARQPDSAPTCEKPTEIVSPLPPPLSAVPSSPVSLPLLHGLRSGACAPSSC
jgi:hypothetical protein